MDDPHDMMWAPDESNWCPACREHFETCNCHRGGDAVGTMLLTAILAIIVGLIVWALLVV